MSRQSGVPPLVAVWSPSSVTLYDPSTQQLTNGPTLASLVSRTHSGRDLVVGISQRNTFVRILPAPNVPRVELAKIISLRLVPLLPVGGQEYVSGFRVGGGAHGQPRIAVVGAVRAELLRAVHSEARDAGLSVRAVLPFAFAAWLLAKERSIADCAVVSSVGDSLFIDIVKTGELAYSRSIPVPETDEEFQDELERTFRIAEVDHLPVLAAGSVNVLADITDPRPLVHQFADVGAIERSLFSLEPLETTIAREARIRRAVAGRAIAATAIALVLGAYVALSLRAKLVTSANRLEADKLASKQFADESVSQSTRAGQVRDSRKIIETAFQPAQRFSDVIQVLGVTSSPKSWFTGLTLERGKLVLIRGNALDQQTVAKYVAELAQDRRFRGMTLVFTHKAIIAKRPVIQFAVSGRVVGNLPLDQVPKDVNHA
jgi:hypothetical protein